MFVKFIQNEDEAQTLGLMMDKVNFNSGVYLFLLICP